MAGYAHQCVVDPFDGGVYGTCCRIKDSWQAADFSHDIEADEVLLRPFPGTKELLREELSNRVRFLAETLKVSGDFKLVFSSGADVCIGKNCPATPLPMVAEGPPVPSAPLPSGTPLTAQPVVAAAANADPDGWAVWNASAATTPAMWDDAHNWQGASPASASHILIESPTNEIVVKLSAGMTVSSAETLTLSEHVTLVLADGGEFCMGVKCASAVPTDVQDGALLSLDPPSPRAQPRPPRTHPVHPVPSLPLQPKLMQPSPVLSITPSPSPALVPLVPLPPAGAHERLPAEERRVTSAHGLDTQMLRPLVHSFLGLVVLALLLSRWSWSRRVQGKELTSMADEEAVRHGS